MRQAASEWENHYAERLESVGFRRGVSCGVVFYHEEKDISLVVHGDDFTFVGPNDELAVLLEKKEQKSQLTVGGVPRPSGER